MEQENKQDSAKFNKRQKRKIKKVEIGKAKVVKKEQKNRIDDAKQIANKSKMTINSQYNSVSNRFVRVVQKINSWLDQIINSPSSSKLFALIIAVFFFVSLTGFGSSFTQSIASGDTLKDVPLNATYNDEVYEVRGLPETVDLTLTGDRSSISATRTTGNFEAYVDLTGLKEGKNFNVPIRYKGIVGDLRVDSNPTNVDVTIEKKVSQSFSLDHMYINTNQKDGVFILGTPVIDTSSVIVRASKETLNEISSVRAVIDSSVVNQVGEYTQQANIIAYDQQGLPLNVDIIPKDVRVTFKVTSPSKDVKMNIIPIGTPKDGFAISSLVANNETTKIYAAQEVLDTMESIDIFVDVDGLSKDDKIIASVPLPAGVSKTTVTNVGILVKFGPSVSETITVPLRYTNNSGYTVRTESQHADVVVTGTRERIDALKTQMAEQNASSSQTPPPISIFFDMAGLTPGRHDNVPLQVRANDATLRLELVRNTINITIGE